MTYVGFTPGVNAGILALRSDRGTTSEATAANSAIPAALIQPPGYCQFTTARYAISANSGPKSGISRKNATTAQTIAPIRAVTTAFGKLSVSVITRAPDVDSYRADEQAHHEHDRCIDGAMEIRRL